jgi:hypothetical protein
MTTIIRHRRGTTTQWASSTYVLKVAELGFDTTLKRFKVGDGVSLWSALSFIDSALDTEAVQDIVGGMVDGNTETNIVVEYDDTTGKLNFSTGPDVITQSSLSNTLTDPTSGYVSIGDIGVADGVASLDSNGKIPLTELGNLIDSAPEALNTLNELAAAINDDASYAATITTALGNKLDSSTASSTYLTQSNASSTYATQTALSAKLDSSAFTYASITIPVYTAVADLPSAGDNHGRWAHVHGEGAMYFAHGGSWYRALSQSDLYVSTNPQAAGYTVLTSDLGKMIEMSGGGTLTITDSASFPAGFTVDVLQTTSSQVTIAGNGFTPNATPGLKLRTQWSSATLIKRALNSWVVLGDLSA